MEYELKYQIQNDLYEMYPKTYEPVYKIKEKYRKQLQRQPSNIELKVWATVKEKLRQKNEEDLFAKLLNSPEFKKVVESKQMENAKKTVSGFEGKKPEEVKQQLDKVGDDIENIIQLMESRLESVKNKPIERPEDKDLDNNSKSSTETETEVKSNPPTKPKPMMANNPS